VEEVKKENTEAKERVRKVQKEKDEDESMA